MAEPVNLFTITSFFSEAPLRVKKGLNSFNSNRVISVSVLPGGIFKGRVQASMKKMIYEVEVHVEGQSVRYSTCECPIGRDKCHHMAAWLIWVEKNVSRTDVECSWKRAKTSKTDEIAAKRVSEMTPSTTRAGIKRPVTQEDKEWALASLSKLGRFTGMGWILSPEPPQACDWGILHEPRAKQQYTEHTGVDIQERGLFLSDSGLLGGSPDGTVSGDYIIEVKCPWSARTKTILQAAESKDFFLELEEVTGALTLKPTHHYWHQIQGNLHLTRANCCHLLVWTPLDFVILTVLIDPTWVVNIDTLETFYKNCFLPHIVSQN
ncbi:uncharacterized protein LOC134322724 isoform X1 [Trichomycterus rosablanca]|uniref:uncharacterized protein LOC134322724 isoform X1 n=1 Tax=Trichomycterus rosablanca TaxID=2290929 RepID=UPI002F350145